MPVIITLILSTLLLLPLSAQAATAITCHCFTDRSYDPSRPALADPYFLATTQNSFFAAYFNVDKKTIVMKKQTGSSADDLWIAYWMALKTGSAAEVLLSMRDNNKSWKEVVVPLRLPVKLLGKRFAAEVSSRASEGRLAQIVVDDVLTRHRLLGAPELAALRKDLASNQEVIISALIAASTRQPAIQIYRDVKKGTRSWGAFLGEAKIQPSLMQSAFSTLLK